MLWRILSHIVCLVFYKHMLWNSQNWAVSSSLRSVHWLQRCSDSRPHYHLHHPTRQSTSISSILWHDHRWWWVDSVPAQNGWISWLLSLLDGLSARFWSLSGEFWLGLDKIHHLTSTPTQLRVDMRDFEGNSAYAQYSSFSVGDSSSKYTLSVSGYSGTAGDSLDDQNGQKFTTRDQDNDAAGENCAQAGLQRCLVV